MSTKIYNGSLINVSTLKEYQDFINDMRKKLKLPIHKLVWGQAVVNAVAMIDMLVTDGDDKRLDSSYSFIANGMDEYREIYDMDRSSLGVTHETSVAVFMLDDKVLAMPFMEQPLLNIWWDDDRVEPYGYWNNTDPSEDCTEEEWAEREEDWDKALFGMGVPSECGSITEFSSPDFLFVSPMSLAEDDTKDFIAGLLPNFVDRHLSIVKREFLHNTYDEYVKANGIKDFSISMYYNEWQDDFVAYKETVGYAARVLYYEELLPEITLDLLYSKSV